jgi:hypothetical protein
MISTHDEDEIDKHLDRGFCTKAEWISYWWTQRAYALQQIAALQEQIRFLQGYVDRCAERIDRPTVRTGV